MGMVSVPFTRLLLGALHLSAMCNSLSGTFHLLSLFSAARDEVYLTSSSRYLAAIYQ